MNEEREILGESLFANARNAAARFTSSVKF